MNSKPIFSLHDRMQCNLANCDELWTKSRWIRMRVLYSVLHGAEGKCTRYSQWMERAIKQLQKANLLKLLPEIDPNKPKDIKLVSPETAMYLLIYGPNAAYHTRYVEQIAEACNLTIPHTRGKSRYEEAFAIKLIEVIQDITDKDNGIEIDLKQQVNTGKHIVDFLLTVTKSFSNTPLETIIIEFDEEYHKSKRQQRIDKVRDKHHLEMGIRTIRVKLEEMERWLGFTEMWEYPFDDKSYLIYIAKEAIRTHPVNGRAYVSSESAQISWDLDWPVAYLDNTKQPLRAIGKILTQLGVPSEVSKMKIKGVQHRILLIDTRWENMLTQIKSTRYSKCHPVCKFHVTDNSNLSQPPQILSQRKFINYSGLINKSADCDTCDTKTDAIQPHIDIHTTRVSFLPPTKSVKNPFGTRFASNKPPSK
ncbi:hypothetical protein [Shewanella algae]|uniref:hypothetical protein n=1 Tax=Shewanella algae TaxID=38313 RepID=UPI003C46EF59